MKNVVDIGTFVAILLLVAMGVLYLSITSGWDVGIAGIAVCVAGAAVSFSLTARGRAGRSS